jgi:hypothetical protein
MKLHLKMFGIPDVILGRRETTRLSAKQRALLEEAVEGVVDGIEPKMRLVRGYRKKLQPVVATAHAYIDALVEQIPGPLFMTPKAFVKDPYVNAFFATPREVSTVFSGSPELREFFARGDNANIDVACGLLCMVEEEKSVLGMELAQGAIRRDVSQTSVNFSDHKVLTPGATEADARLGLKNCIFNALVSHALQHIADLKAQRRELQDQRRILYARLRARQAYNGGLDTLLATASAGEAGSGDIEGKLAETEAQLEHAPAIHDAPRDYLREVIAILEQPQEFIRLRRVSFQLTRMGIKVEENSDQPAHSIELAEIEVTNVLKRVVAIVCYPRDDMLPEPDDPSTRLPLML